MKNLFLIIVFVGLGALAINYFGLLESNVGDVQEREVYGKEYGEHIKALKEVNMNIMNAELVVEAAMDQLEDLHIKREQIVLQGGSIITGSLQYAEQGGLAKYQPAIEPITGDIDVGLYDQP